MARKLQGTGREKTRTALGLTRWQMDIVDTFNFIARHPDGSYNTASITRIVNNPASFTRKLDAEVELNATDAAARLGVPIGRFKKAVDATGLNPSSEGTWKWGTVRYYRTKDVDKLTKWLDAYAARPAVAKASATRAHKAAVREQAARDDARVRVNAAYAEFGTDPHKDLAWASALDMATGRLCVTDEHSAALVPFRAKALQALAADVTAAAFDDQELGVLLAQAGQRVTDILEGELVPVGVLAASFAVPVGALQRKLGASHGLAARSAVLMLIADGVWLDTARYAYAAGARLAQTTVLIKDLRLARQRQQQVHAQRARQQASERSAQRRRRWAALTEPPNSGEFTNADVANIFALPIDVVAALVPKSGRWSPAYVRSLLVNPGFLDSEERARARITERAAAHGKDLSCPQR